MCINKFYCWNNRTGNHLIAYIYLLYESFIKNNCKEIQIPEHGVFNFETKNKENKVHCQSNTIKDLTREINPCGDRISLHLMKQICRKYATLKFDIPDTPLYDICVHIRDGDIFSNLVHFEYVQPSFDYYYQSIMNNKGKSICILYSDGNSPIIPLIRELIEKEGLENVVFRHGSLKEDISILCSCKMLVWSFSSFCVIPYIFSNCLKVNIMPESIIKRTRGRPWFHIDEHHTDLVVIKHSQYILTGYWKNTKEQVDIIKNYKLDSNEVDKFKNLDT